MLSALLFPALASLLTGAVVWFLKKKFNLALTAAQEAQLTQVFQKAIAFAEEWAVRQTKSLGHKPAAAEKLEKAAEFARKEISRMKLSLPEDRVADFIHAALGQTR